MNSREREFLERLRATFVVEARDHLQVIAGGLLVLESAEVEAERALQLETVFRHTHSLKGAARAAGFPDIEAICQAIEEVFSLCKRQGRLLVADDFDGLHRAFDQVSAWVDSGTGASAVDASGNATVLLRQLKAMRLVPQDAAASTVQPASARYVAVSDAADAPAIEAPAPEAAEVPGPSPSSRETIRVSARRLDRMLLAAEELLTVRQASAERSRDLQQLESALEEWGKRWLALQAPMRRMRAAADTGADGLRGDAPRQVLEFLDWSHGYVRSLEGRVHALGRAAARDGHLAARQIDSLLDESKGLLMTSFSAATEGLLRLARDLGREQRKDVSLLAESDGVQLDRRIIEALKDPLAHLVRNAIDHGIETPSERRAAGKPERATIRVQARLAHGNNVVVEIADDGGGLDPARLRTAATRAGLLDEVAAMAMDDAAALELAFRSDVSTSPVITEISGRGLGLAIVMEHVERLGGRVSLQSSPGEGARFSIMLPQSLATLRGLFVEAGGQRFIIPTAQVRRVARFPRDALKTVSRRQTLSIGGRTLVVSSLDEIIGVPPNPGAGTSSFVSFVILGTDQDELALAVDDVLEVDEVLVRRLRRPLVRVRHVAGATVLPSGRVVPILNVADLLKSARRDAPRREAVQTAATARVERMAKVLLAEDSITSRLLLKNILESAGCEVKAVADGIEAFTALRSEAFDLLVSDIEMPRLNGFDLTSRVRAEPTLAAMPVILVTALSRREDRERGFDVGANAYITKGGFDQRDLLDAIRRLVTGAHE